MSLFDGLFRRAARAAERIPVQLDGGPRDGATYQCPAAYPGGDGLPDAIALVANGAPALYIRRRDSRTYDYRGASNGHPDRTYAE